MSSLAELESAFSNLQSAFEKRTPEVAEAAAGLLNEWQAFAATNAEAVVDKAVESFNQGKLYAAEQLCRLVLKSAGKHIKAMHLLATIATRLGHNEDAVQILLDCLDINPYLAIIHYDLANAFFRSGNFELALRQCNELIANDPGNKDYAGLKAAALVKLGRYDDAIVEYEKILAEKADDVQVRLRYGVALRIVGRTPEAIDAFRNVIGKDPGSGEAWWNLANLKTLEFDASDIDAMQAALNAEGPGAANRAFLLFALGKAQDNAGQFDEAFQSYRDANELAKQAGNYNPDDTSGFVDRCMEVFTSAYFEARRNACQADDPIFIVGLPRSGSTLLEQILSNHSQVDATMELSEIPAMVRSLNNPNRTGMGSQFPGVMTELAPEERERLGEEYLKRTRSFRGSKRFFIDKTPHNVLHIGLIKSILPNAKIIDARRSPMAAGFSIYTQYFARGTGYAYDLEHIGRYYRNYLRLMDHWHEVLPGQLLTVQYEDVVGDMEAEVRKILDYCDLDFEPGCLEFYKSKRAVATVSSEQVRQPIYDSSLLHWKHYEAHLQPLKNAVENDNAPGPENSE